VRELADTSAAARSVLAGEIDDRLGLLEQAIARRRDQIAADLGLHKGSRIRFSGSCPEPHLRGTTHTVRELPGRCVVTSDCSVLLTWFARGYAEVVPRR
jgi:hypothetical protein